MELGGLPWNYALAMILALAGLMLMGCGVTVCWKRWRCWSCKSVDEIRREEDKRVSREKTPQPGPSNVPRR